MAMGRGDARHIVAATYLPHGEDRYRIVNDKKNSDTSSTVTYPKAFQKA